MVKVEAMCDTVITVLSVTILSSVGYTTGQQVGVSLVVQGETAPNNSFVDIDDILRIHTDEGKPSNSNPRSHDQAMLCITDLVDCCEKPRLGGWYYFNGGIIQDQQYYYGALYSSNRGQYEFRDGRQFYGSVRLYQFFFPSGYNNGQFPYTCELPDANNVTQTLYANIVDFGMNRSISPVMPFDLHDQSSPQANGTTTAGEVGYSVGCATILVEPSPLPAAMPTPTFQWFFGPNGSDSLPSGLTPPTTFTVNDTNIISYMSMLEFPQLSQRLHAGMYTCRIGAGRLSNTVTVDINDPVISVAVNPNLNTFQIAGQTGTTLTCNVTGADNLNPTIIYEWTKDNEANDRSETLTLSPLRLSHAGVYTCSVNVSSTFLNNDIQASANNSEIVMIEITNPQSITVTSSQGGAVLSGTNVIVTCTVELGPSVMSESDRSLITVEAWLFKDGNELIQTSNETDGSTYTFGFMVSSFSESDEGDYNCSAIVIPLPTSSYLTGMSQGESDPFPIIVAEISPAQSTSTTGIIGGVFVVLVALVAVAVALAAFIYLCWYRRRQSAAMPLTSSKLHL